MSDMIVLRFPTLDGAEKMRDELKNLQKMHVIELEDAAVVVRPTDGKPKVKQAVSLVGSGALGGAFWGMLIGLLFFAPWLGMIAGAVGGAIGGGAGAGRRRGGCRRRGRARAAHSRPGREVRDQDRHHRSAERRQVDPGQPTAR